MPLGLLTFIVGVAFIPGLPSDATVGRWVVLAVGASIILWKIRVHPTPAHWAGAALLAWIALGLWWAVSFWDHVGGAWQWLVVAAVFLIGAETQDLTGAWKGLAAAVTVSAGFSIAQALGHDVAWTVWRAGSTGLFLSKNMASEIAVLALIGAIGIRSWALAIGPAVACFLVGSSRTVALSLIVAGLVWAWLQVKPRDRGVAAMGVLGMACLAATYFVSHPDVLARLAFIDDRLTIWSLLVPNIHLIGDGLGSVGVAALAVEFAHNEFIHYAFELGAPSVLIWGIVVYGFGAESVLTRVALAALLAQCLVWFPLHAPATAMVGALLAGHLCGARGRARVSQLGSREGGLGGAGFVQDALGAGSISTADIGRFDLPFRQKPTMGG